MPGTLKQIEDRLKTKMAEKEKTAWSGDLPGEILSPRRPTTHTVKTRGASPPIPIRKMPQLVHSKPAPRPPASFDIEGDDAAIPEPAPHPAAPAKPMKRPALAKKTEPTEPPGSKTVGVKVPPSMYKELLLVKEARNLPSLKEALLLAAKHGLPLLRR